MAVATNDSNSLASSFNSTPSLGSYPEQPVRQSTLFGLSRQAAATSAGFTVDTTSREQTRNFYNALYPASEGVPMGWTGDLATCSAGTTSPGFKEAVRLRVNFFRAMAGVPAAITFSDISSAKSQQAALMMSRNNALNHKPPNTWSCYSTDGFEAAGKSNLGLGNSGAAAVTGSFMDFGVSNGAVGHRRWLLYPQTQVMGTGDIPDTTGYSAASSLWVVDGYFGTNRQVTREEFVAWPPPGYVPYQIVFSRWSFAYPGADFSSAGVTMTRNGVTLPVRLETFVANVGENTLVWVPDNMPTSTVSNFSRPGADTPYTVTVSNVKISGVPRDFNYTVTVFDPQTPGADKMSTVITGSTTPSAGFAALYAISPVSGADSYQWQSAVSTPFTGSYGAENGLAGITSTLSSGYSPVASGISASGSASYHLAHPGSTTIRPTDQLLTLDRTFLAGPSSKLRFKSRLGWASVNQTAMVELSTDGGITWQQIYQQVGSGGAGEVVFSSRTVDLSPYAERIITLRFAYRVASGTYFYQTDPGVGWYLDDIAFDMTGEVTGVVPSSVTAIPTFNFTPPAVGDYILMARPLLYGQYLLEWGPVLHLTSQYPAQLSLTLTGSGSGTVATVPSGMTCSTGSCSQLFPTGLHLLLVATPDSNSLFGGWSGGGCSGFGGCSVSMTTTTAVTSRFDYVQPLRVPLANPSEYSSLTTAYGAVPDGGSILARVYTFTEDLVLDRNKMLYLTGGYDTRFSSSSGLSEVIGRLTITRGTLVTSGIVIK